MKRTLFAVTLLALLSACSTLNSHGIGGEPVLACRFRDGAAYLDDKVAGSDAVHASAMRRFTDGDGLCVSLKPIGVDLVSAAPAASAAK